MISKAAKEKKMREKIESEIQNKTSFSISKVPKVLLFGLPVLGGYLLYKWSFSKKEKEDVKTLLEKEIPDSQKESKVKFETLG